MKRWFRILKIKFIRRCGFKLTNSERIELAYWITRNVKTSVSETLRELNDD
jgi:hypothetical protein